MSFTIGEGDWELILPRVSEDYSIYYSNNIIIIIVYTLFCAFIGAPALTNSSTTGIWDW